MVMLVTEPSIEEQLIAERQARGIDQHDEVWDGVYVVSPIANIEHQRLIARLMFAFQVAIGPNSGVFPGVNITDQVDDWRKNYRVPDVAVFLEGNCAQDRDSHWLGGPDFAVEVVSPHDRARLKLDFYARVGVRELLIVDRNPWSLELYRLSEERLVLVGTSTPESPDVLDSEVLPLRLRLVMGDSRPWIEIEHHDGRQTWRV